MRPTLGKHYAARRYAREIAQDGAIPWRGEMRAQSADAQDCTTLVRLWLWKSYGDFGKALLVGLVQPCTGWSDLHLRPFGSSSGTWSLDDVAVDLLYGFGRFIQDD